jgi:ABC-type Zn2+ transport system substrate-binding protein/surface adhesin
VVRAFADLRPLDALFGKIERIPFKTVERDLKAYIAKELRRLAKIRSIPVEQLCDVTDRTLRSWIDDARKESSESRNISSKNHKVK